MITPTARRQWLLSALASALLLAAGCRPAEPGPSANVPDIPVYPGARLGQQVAADATVAPTLEGPRDPVDFYVIPGAAAADVLAWYRQQMPKHGWTPVSDPADDVVLYTTAAGCDGFVVVTQVDRDVELQLSQQNPAVPCEVVPTEDPGNR
jgi:hypothetical protein